MSKGLQYEKDINRLKELKATDESKYIAERSIAAEKYKVSVRTIQRDMKKDKLVRKQREDSGKPRKNLTDKENQMLTEIRSAGKSKKEAVKIVEEKTGKKISTRVASRAEPKLSTDKATLFGEDARKFFEEFFEFDLIAPENGIKFKYKNVSFILDKEHLTDIILSLTDAYNRAAEDSGKLQLDRNKYTRSQIFALINYQVSVAKMSGNISDLDKITRMYQRMEIDYGAISPDLKVVMSVCRVLKPDITEDEVFSLIKKFTDE